MNDTLLEDLQKIPEGFSKGEYNGRTYGISKTIFNHGKSLKLYAEELGGTDFVSLNYYFLKGGHKLKPCEMAEQKVRLFLRDVVLKTTKETEAKSTI